MQSHPWLLTLIAPHSIDLLLILCPLVSLKSLIIISKSHQTRPDAAFPSLDLDCVLSSHFHEHTPSSLSLPLFFFKLDILEIITIAMPSRPRNTATLRRSTFQNSYTYKYYLENGVRPSKLLKEITVRISRISLNLVRPLC